MPNWSQLSGVVERLVTAAVMFAVGKGWITTADTANIIALVLGLASVLYAFFVNRNTNLVKQAASVPGTQVVTSDAIADAIPASNVKSDSTNKVVSKFGG